MKKMFQKRKQKTEREQAKTLLRAYGSAVWAPHQPQTNPKFYIYLNTMILAKLKIGDHFCCELNYDLLYIQFRLSLGWTVFIQEIKAVRYKSLKYDFRIL